MTATLCIEQETPSSLNVSNCQVSYKRYCNCGRRWRCPTCYRSWIGKRKKAIHRFLDGLRGAEYIEVSATFTVPPQATWIETICLLAELWTKLQRERSKAIQRKRNRELGLIRGGIAGIHLTNSQGQFNPHIHATFICHPSLPLQIIQDAWINLGGGIQLVEEIEDIGRWVHYSIKEKHCFTEEQLGEIESLLAGFRMVRRMGSSKYAKLDVEEAFDRDQQQTSDHNPKPSEAGEDQCIQVHQAASSFSLSEPMPSDIRSAKTDIIIKAQEAGRYGRSGDLIAENYGDDSYDALLEACETEEDVEAILPVQQRLESSPAPLAG